MVMGPVLLLLPLLPPMGPGNGEGVEDGVGEGGAGESCSTRAVAEDERVRAVQLLEPAEDVNRRVGGPVLATEDTERV